MLWFKLKTIVLLFIESEKNVLNSTEETAEADKAIKNALRTSLTTANSADEVKNYLILAIVVTIVSVSIKSSSN